MCARVYVLGKASFLVKAERTKARKVNHKLTDRRCLTKIQIIFDSAQNRKLKMSRL